MIDFGNWLRICSTPLGTWSMKKNSKVWAQNIFRKRTTEQTLKEMVGDRLILRMEEPSLFSRMPHARKRQ